jgi:hypothetical protein
VDATEYHDVYIFAGGAEPTVVEDRRKLGKDQPVRYIALTTGAFQAFAVMEVENLSDIPGAIRDTFGNPTLTAVQTAVPILHGPRQIRWTKQYAHGAFSRIRAKAGRGRDVLAATSVVEGYNGSAIVAGAFDVLVEYGADTLRDLKDRLLHGLHDSQGIHSSDTAFVTDYFYRGPRDEDPRPAARGGRRARPKR